MEMDQSLHSIRRSRVVMSTGLRWLGHISPFFRSDSSSVELRLLDYKKFIPVYVNSINSNKLSITRTGSNSQNTAGVRRAGPSDQALSLLKADGARSVMPKRSRRYALCDYFRVSIGVPSDG